MYLQLILQRCLNGDFEENLRKFIIAKSLKYILFPY